MIMWQMSQRALYNKQWGRGIVLALRQPLLKPAFLNYLYSKYGK